MFGGRSTLYKLGFCSTSFTFWFWNTFSLLVSGRTFYIYNVMIHSTSFCSNVMIHSSSFCRLCFIPNNISADEH